MKRFYTYLLLFLVFIFSIHYSINNGSKIIKVVEKDLIGEYTLKFRKHFYYKLILQDKNQLTLVKKYRDKTKLIRNGTWHISYTNGSESIEVKIPNLNSIDFSLGEINKNLFTGKVKIEAFSMGNFLGKEDDAFFIKAD